MCDQKSHGQVIGQSKHVRDQVVPVLVLLQTTEGHLGARNVLLGVLKVGELEMAMLASRTSKERLRKDKNPEIHTRVSSFHSIPFCLLASVYA